MPPEHDPRQDLDDMVRVRTVRGGAEAFVWWTGDVYAWLPGDGPHHLFGFEGVNVARTKAVDGGVELLSREAASYLDPVTREVADDWKNRYTGENVAVEHVWNDPVDFRWLAEGPYGPFRAPRTRIGDDVVFNTDVLLAYPSPLPVAEYPANSGDDVYRAMELFQFFTRAADLDDPGLDSVPCTLSWVRVAPWVPWMRMADRPGAMVYHCRGAKVAGWDEVPGRLRRFVEERRPEFQHAPAEWSSPSETSWTAFKKLHPAESAG
ncbi:DUF1838 family protein [Actinomadura sp. BRA 177]|uniref:DUF1838 family protein n=1 Tax=Actinomadura sp. BRA 177 TaxID=2745202 RepID=UPI001594F441|nr:DUF1838 family protein [Actinomadura sp. BRA 177]NVI92786.1 DUF1838 family protein [Actinomadura sp. BRA 177]